MAKKKFYAVKIGQETSIYNTWDECKAVVDGKIGVKYKGFSTFEEAQAFLSGESLDNTSVQPPPKNTLLAYVDGSYEDSIKCYAFGCVFITPDGQIIEKFGNGTNPESATIRNVAGEMIGAMYATKWALVNGFSEIEIRYDYEGIEKWVTGVWKAKNELTLKYATFMHKMNSSIKLHFTKVAAHTNNKYNDLADALAKKGLVEGMGVPAIEKEII